MKWLPAIAMLCATVPRAGAEPEFDRIRSVHAENADKFFENVKWQMRTWNRTYQPFADKSAFHPGRLDKETQAMIKEMFWLYVTKMSRFERATPQHVRAIHGLAVDLRPKMLLDSPFLSSEHGSGIVTIHKGELELRIDLNKNGCREILKDLLFKIFLFVP